MTTPATRGRRAAGRPLKSPLAVAHGYATASSAPDPAAAPDHAGAALSDREATLAEFEDYLRTINNRDKRPYEEKAIQPYL